MKLEINDSEKFLILTAIDEQIKKLVEKETLNEDLYTKEIINKKIEILKRYYRLINK